MIAVLLSFVCAVYCVSIVTTPSLLEPSYVAKHGLHTAGWSPGSGIPAGNVKQITGSFVVCFVFCELLKNKKVTLLSMELIKMVRTCSSGCLRVK